MLVRCVYDVSSQAMLVRWDLLTGDESELTRPDRGPALQTSVEAPLHGANPGPPSTRAPRRPCEPRQDG